MKIIILVIVPLAFSSCMHVGMMGTGDSHHSGAAHEMTAQPVLEKEVLVGDVRAIALFPRLELGQEALLTLRLVDVRSGRPLTGAAVSLQVTYVHDPAIEHAHTSGGANQHVERHGDVRTEVGHNIDINQQVDESSEPGVYTISYGSHQPGDHTLAFHISAIGDHKLAPGVTVEATRTIPTEGHDHKGAGGTTATTYLLIGAGIMGAMMVAMLTARGHLF